MNIDSVTNQGIFERAGTYVARALNGRNPGNGQTSLESRFEMLARGPYRTNAISNPEFYIEELEDRYRLHNVPCDGELWNYDWAKELLNGGKTATQDQHIANTKDSEFKVPSLKKCTATIMALVDYVDVARLQQKDITDKIIGMFRQKSSIMTSTRVAYEPNGKDKGWHDFGYATQSEFQEDLVGPDGAMNAGGEMGLDCCPEEAAKALFGTPELERVKTAYKKVTDDILYVLKLNNEPANETLRAVVFGRYISLDCYIYANGCAFGVAASRAENFQAK